ncbi:MAG: ISNCY family transposase [Gemmatimonadaceae bacterium]
MSDREFTRAAILRRVSAGEITIKEATPLLGVSYRQAKRLAARFRSGGRKALVHGNTARRSNRAIPSAHREQVVELVRAHYGGSIPRGPGQRFGPTLAAEHLWADHDVLVAVSTLARWMRDVGLWGRVRRARPRHQRRERKAHFGELVQLDGSFHDWFEGRGPRACVMTMVDDATGRTLLRFGHEETIWAAAGILQAWIAAYGMPSALYTDWKNVYLRAPTNNELARGEAPLTQFGRMCTKLGIRLIGAASPQAKGRVERGHGTHQDRLIKKLRLRGISDVAAANAFVAAAYLPAHNARFAIAPANAIDHHRPRACCRRIDADVFCLETSRVVGNDHVVQYDGRALQLDPGVRGRIPAKSRVLIRESEAGALRVVHVARDGRERVLPWNPATARAAKPPRVQAPPSNSTSPVLAVAAKPAHTIPAADHPWRVQHRRWKAEAILRKQQTSLRQPVLDAPPES